VEPLGGGFAEAVGVFFDGDEGEADLEDAEIDGAAEADAGEDEEGFFFVELVGDDEVLVDVEELAGEEGESAGGEVAGEDVDPGLSGLGGEVEPEGVGEIDARHDAAVGAGAWLLGVEARDEGLHVGQFFAR
jgi:hypothetical protein